MNNEHTKKIYVSVLPPALEQWVSLVFAWLPKNPLKYMCYACLLYVLTVVFACIKCCCFSHCVWCYYYCYCYKHDSDRGIFLTKKEYNSAESDTILMKLRKYFFSLQNFRSSQTMLRRVMSMCVTCMKIKMVCQLGCCWNLLANMVKIIDCDNCVHIKKWDETLWLL